MKKILIIEDDKEIAELERDYLSVSHFESDIIDDGEKGLQAALKNDYALVLLDIMLPGINGFEICQRIREEKNIPVIIVSAKREDQDKINALGLGANDFIMKPFHPGEMVARVKSQIEHYERLTNNSTQPSSMIYMDTITINTDSHEVFIDDVLTTFPNKEYELLLFLCKHPNTVFSKSQLFETIWGLDAIGEISTVTVHINRIRDKIEKDSANPKIIETVWGSGYRLRK